jgi:hypothetical protein
LSLYQGATTRDCLEINHTMAIANNMSTSMYNGTERNGVFTEYYDGEYIDWVPCPKTMQCDVSVYQLCHAIPYQYTGDLPDEINSFGFDNFRNALMTVFIVSTLDEWPQLADPIRSAPLMANGTAWTFYALVSLRSYGAYKACAKLTLPVCVRVLVRSSTSAGGFPSDCINLRIAGRELVCCRGQLCVCPCGGRRWRERICQWRSV